VATVSDPHTSDQAAEIRLVSPSERDRAADLLAPATGEGTSAAALEKIAEAEQNGGVLLGAFLGQELIAAYTICRDGMANQVSLIAVREDLRRRGIGKSLLHDALQRSGRRPITIETDDAGLPFYKACGFKVFGRRPQPSGGTRWRLGWHAPRTEPAGESGT
jgi:GNAT superfamily N-acetyltransferase